jgi:circadian clock protein KaiB
MTGPETIAERFEARLREAATSHYVLTLFVTGASDLSSRAIINIRVLCEEHLAGRYTLQVVDVHKDPQLMSSYDLVAAPALIKESPQPKRMLVGDLSDTARVLAALDLADPSTMAALTHKE